MTKEEFKSIIDILIRRYDFDSLDLVEFSMELEKKGISIPDEWLNKGVTNMEIPTPKYDVGQRVWVLGWEIATYKRVPVECIVNEIEIEKHGGPTCPWWIFYLVQQWDSKDCCIDWTQFPRDDGYDESPSYFHRDFEQDVFPDKQGVLDEIARREYEAEHLFDE